MALALLVFALCLLACNCNIITIDSMECVPNKELCINHTCLISVSRNNQQKINAGCYLPKPIYHMIFDVKMQRKRAGAYETLVSAKENVCQVAQRTIRSQFMARVFESVHQYVNNFHCPFTGNVSASNLPVSLSFVPGFLPKAQYRVLVDVRNKEEPLILVDVKISIGPKKEVSNKKN